MGVAFFALGGSRPCCLRAQLATPEAGLVDPETFNQGVHGARVTMILLAVVPASRGFRELHGPADDRRAGRRVPAHQRPVVLAVARRRHRPLLQLPRRRRARHRLVLLRAALRARVRAGNWRGLLHPRSRGERRRHDHRRDQPGRDDPADALPGHGHLSRSALRLDDPGDERPHPRRVPALTAALSCSSSTGSSAVTSSTLPAVARRCCGSTSSGSSDTPRSTSWCCRRWG